MDAFLPRRGIAVIPYDDPRRLGEALMRGEIDAVASGEPELRYVAEHLGRDRIAISSAVLDVQFVAFALPADSPLVRPIDAAILEELQTDEWLRRRLEVTGR